MGCVHHRDSTLACIWLLFGVSFIGVVSAAGPTQGLVGHWPLDGDGRDASGGNRAAVASHIQWAAGPKRGVQAAKLDGRASYLEVPSGLHPGRGDFSIAAWVHTERALDDTPGDIVSQYSVQRRRGFHLTLKTNAGVTFNQANQRQLQFGVDDDRDGRWIDVGRPGKESLLAFALAVFDGQLYAGTCEPGEGQTGRVYRYAGGESWVDCGSPMGCNAVTSLAVFDGQLYAGVGKYRVAGSALTESPNTTLGGHVFRYEGDSRWTDCGKLADAEAVGGLVVYRGSLYASSLYRPAGFFRYDPPAPSGLGRWVDSGTPDGKRVEALGVYNGFLYATSYDGGHVYRYDGKTWTDCGQLGGSDNTQTYSFAVHHGRLYVGTWASGRVYRFEHVDHWTDVGRLGEELEVMGMLVHNGRLMAGTLPLAEVHEFDGESNWRLLARLDHTPDVKYRRAWTMAEYQGRLFCSTLPSGRVHAYTVGAMATWDKELPAGWQHVAAVKTGRELALFVNGNPVGTAAGDMSDYDLTSDQPLRIGLGANDYFAGSIADVRWYNRALTADELREMSK